MAGHNRQHRLRDISNTGFGSNSGVEGGRLVNPDGTNNLKKRGIPLWERISIYHSLLRMDWRLFFLCIFLFYSTVNLVFALCYMTAGVENLTNAADGARSVSGKFMEAFFFSSQTLTTVGYGHMAPRGLLTNSIASLESLIGIVSFAIVTGLMYGRFSRPRAYVLFSKNLLIAPYRGGRGLMVRVATYKNNLLTDVEAQLTLGLHITEEGKTVTRFYQLKLEMQKINSLALSWTIVHPLNEESPIAHFTEEDINTSKMEVIVNIKAFDDHFSNLVQQRTSYTHNQVVFGARFLPMFDRDRSGDFTILELDKINAYESVVLPDPVQTATE